MFWKSYKKKSNATQGGKVLSIFSHFPLELNKLYQQFRTKTKLAAAIIYIYIFHLMFVILVYCVYYFQDSGLGHKWDTLLEYVSIRQLRVISTIVSLVFLCNFGVVCIPCWEVFAFYILLYCSSIIAVY